MADNSASGDAAFSKSFLWMFIALFGGLAVLLGGALFMATRVVHTLELSSATDPKTVRTPIGDFRFEKAGQVGLGLPVYPRAALILPGADSLPTPTPKSPRQVLTTIYHSNDPRDFVASWYARHLDTEFTRHTSADNPFAAVLQNARVPVPEVLFVGERGDQIRIVSLNEDSSGTRITFLHFNKGEAQ